MDKNTIWAIVLSAIVLIASLFIQNAYILPKQQAKAQAAAEQQKLEQAEKEEAAVAASESISTSEKELDADGENVIQEANVPEETYTLETEKVKVVFTNKGGDVISYQLKNQYDLDTGDDVQMVDSVSSSNRAFALSFGDSKGSTLNETFTCKRIDDYTIGFYRDYFVKDDLGNENKVQLRKVYNFKPDDYLFRLDISVDSGSNGKGLNVNGASYTLRSSPQIGPFFNIKKNRNDVRQYVSYNGQKKLSKNFGDKTYSKPYTWSGVAGKYFCEIINPVTPTVMSPDVVCSTALTDDYANSQIFLTRLPVEQPSVTDSYYIYVGPRSEKELVKYNNKDKNSWNLYNAKYNEAVMSGTFLSIGFVEKFLKWALEMLNKWINNWGISIIVLTIILKILLFPLNKKSAEGSVKMQQIQPQMTAIQEKYKDNQQKLSEETQKLYKEAGYNPLSGCLPMILQMVILVSLFSVFNNYFEFRGTMFIKGWIDDLSKGDSIWSWKKNIPIISSFTQNNLRLLPIIYTVSSLLMSKLAGGTNAAAAGQSQSTMKFMTYGFPIMIFFLFYNTPAGLLLYWNISNIIQIGQQFIINKMMAKKRAEIESNKKPVNKNELKFKGGKKKTR